jgi:hypothetical protein
MSTIQRQGPGIPHGKLFICSAAVLLATGCVWDETEIPIRAADAAISLTGTSQDAPDMSRMFESEKSSATMSELPAQF